MGDHEFSSLGPQHRPDDIELPIVGPDPTRPDKGIVEALRAASSATTSAGLHRMGVRQTFISGPQPRRPGAKVVGPAVTLQFMPQREDIGSGSAQEQTEKRTALWDVLEHIEPGDILVVQAFGDRHTGCLGEMLVTYLKGRGGVGLVVDGCIRDWPHVQQIGLPLWTVGFTPNFASQASLFPWAYNVPVALSRVLVIPGDIIIADDDGVVVVPRKMASDFLAGATAHEEWEEFSRMCLEKGGSLKTYYPLSDVGRAEYERWRAAGSPADWTPGS